MFEEFRLTFAPAMEQMYGVGVFRLEVDLAYGALGDVERGAVRWFLCHLS